MVKTKMPSQIELIPNASVENNPTTVYESKMYLKSENYGTLIGTVVSHKGYYLAFCPMEISVHILQFCDGYGLENKQGESLIDFYMDNDDVVDTMIYRQFINDDLPQKKLEDIYIKKIIPYMEKEGVLK